MLGLKLPTDPRWVDIASKNIEEILTDHAYCEQKAASSAISIIVHYPERTELVSAMVDLCQEEMGHFRMVHEQIQKRGLNFGLQRKDLYVAEIVKFFPKGGLTRTQKMVAELLISALIEARSCERFRVLSENIKDEELAKFYHELMISEANHYTMFLKFARQYGDLEEVNQKWEALLEFEAGVISQLGTSERIHG
jgi:tRNA 2-(methylsulfanyl)-N6-isopentenyladenosine37 hydroxylase